MSAVPAAPSFAKSASLKGQVVGTPYVADSRSAIPVLLSKQTAKRAGLKSPVGVVILPRTAMIPTPDGRSRPGNLRLGDRFRAVGTITGEARRAVYPRINLRASSAEVYRRGKTLSNAELEALVRKLQAEMNDVRAKLNNLVQWTLGELHGVRADVAVLRSELDSLKAQLATLQAVLDGLKAQLAALDATLSGQISTITSTLTTLTNDLTSLTDDLTEALTELTNVQNLITSLTQQLGGLDPQQLAAALTAITALQQGLDGALADIAALDGILDGADGILGNADDPITALIGQVAGLNAVDAQLQSQITGLTGEVDALQSVVGNAASGLVQQVNTLQSTMNIVCGPTSLLNAIC